MNLARRTRRLAHLTALAALWLVAALGLTARAMPDEIPAAPMLDGLERLPPVESAAASIAPLDVPPNPAPAPRPGIKPAKPIEPRSPSEQPPAETVPPSSVKSPSDSPGAPRPLQFQPLRPEHSLAVWWRDLIRQPIGDPLQALPIELELTVIQGLTHSAQVQVLRDTAAINRTAIDRAEATFDPLAFSETRFTDTSDPVGNTLTTGGAPRFIDETWYSASGVRRRSLTGAQLEASQRLGFQNNNSLFFVPKNQATARLSLSLTQPLLRGAGTAYNSSVVILAQLDSDIAHDQFIRDLQLYLVDLHKAFWDLHLQRAGLLQRRRLLQEAQDVLGELDARKQVDVVGSQLARARSAVATREVAVFRFEASTKNAVSRFRALVNDPFLDNPCLHELIPLNATDACYGDADLCIALSTALDYRPEIHQATRNLRGACVRYNVSKKDLLPLLNMVLGAYSSGLQGQNNFGQAIGDQFSVGRPTYWGGFIFERPLGNRSAQAQVAQRNLEVRRATAQLQAITATVRAEVEIATRDVATTCKEVLAKYQAMTAEQEQIDFLLERWHRLAADQQIAGIVFNDLLDAQDRRAIAELDMVTAQVAHRVAWINLKRATGTLCDCTALVGNEICLPEVQHPDGLGAGENVVPTPQIPVAEPLAGPAPVNTAPVIVKPDVTAQPESVAKAEPRSDPQPLTKPESKPSTTSAELPPTPPPADAFPAPPLPTVIEAPPEAPLFAPPPLPTSQATAKRSATQRK